MATYDKDGINAIVEEFSGQDVTIDEVGAREAPQEFRLPGTASWRQLSGPFFVRTRQDTSKVPKVRNPNRLAANRWDHRVPPI